MTGKKRDDGLTVGSGTIGPTKVLTGADALTHGDGVIAAGTVELYPTLIRPGGAIPWGANPSPPYDHLNSPVPLVRTRNLTRAVSAELRYSARLAASIVFATLDHHERATDPLETLRDAVDLVLERETGEDDRLAREVRDSTAPRDNPKDRLVREVQGHVKALQGKLSDLAARERHDEDDARDLAREADELFTVYLAGMDGAEAREIAARIREGIQPRQAASTQQSIRVHPTMVNPDLSPEQQADAHRFWLTPDPEEGEKPPETVEPPKLEERGRAWQLWLDPVGDAPLGAYPFLFFLARVVWRDVVRPELEEERKRRLQYHPAVRSGTLDMYAGGLFASGRTVVVDSSGRGGDLVDAEGRTIGKVLPGAAVAVIDSRLLDSMRSHVAWTRKTSFIRGFNALVCAAYKSKADDPDNPNPEAHRKVWFEGALQGFAHAACIRARDARRVLDTGQMIQLPMRDGGTLGGLWTWRTWRGNQYRGAGKLRVELQPEVVTIGGHRERLVPVLPPDREPALPRDGALQGPALIAVSLILQWLRSNAIALVDGNPATWGERDWLDIMARVDPGYGARERDAIMGPLRDGDDTRPPLLVFPETGLVTLNADEYGDVLAFLQEGGRKSIERREQGRRGGKEPKR